MRSWARSRATETSEAPARSMPVSVCTRLPTRSARWAIGCSARPTVPSLAGQRVGGAELAEHLRLADDHRVQAGGDGEQVRDGLVLVVHGDVRGELLHRRAGLPGEHPADVGDAAVEAVDLGEDLDPVARRQHQRLADVVARRPARAAP